MEYKLKLGKESLIFNPDRDLQVIQVGQAVYDINFKSFSNDLANYLKPAAGSVGIIISDKTRLCGYELYLPWLTKILENNGYKPEDIVFYIAYGTHPKQTDQESLAAYGDTFNKYKFIHHDCDDNDLLKTYGKTRRGTNLTIRKDIFDHNQLILFGAISHHYFAGYGGGRKLIFPGLAAKDEIYKNHKLFINFKDLKLEEGCQSGNLKGNPVAEDLEEIDSLLPEKIVISGILDSKARVSSLHVGNSYSQFEKVCNMYDKYYRYSGNKKFDLVIASSGGFPKDINFIQTHKSLHNAASFVKDGGQLILLGDCIDGIGNNSFIDIFKESGESVFRSLEKKYSGNGGTALSLMSKTRRIRVSMITSLEKNLCKTLNINKIDHKTAAEIIETTSGDIGLIQNASLIFC